MTKTIRFKETARDKASNKEMFDLAEKVKTKKHKIGSTGELALDIFYKAVKGGFIIF